MNDLPIGGRCVRLFVRARRFFCDASSCRRCTFAERLDRRSALRVAEAQDMDPLGEGMGYVCPGRQCMELEMPPKGPLRMRVKPPDERDRYAVRKERSHLDHLAVDGIDPVPEISAAVPGGRLGLHLAGADLRMVAPVDAAAEDGMVVALGQIETLWRTWLRAWVAKHKCE